MLKVPVVNWIVNRNAKAVVRGRVADECGSGPSRKIIVWK
jgi:hypothetical protein